MNHTDLLQFAVVLAEASGKVIRPYFRAEGLVVERKTDDSPVTIADREAEATLRRLIKARYPGHGIIGEEYGSEHADAEYVWVLDPIDSTISFTHGCPLFGTLIALLHRGEPVIGVIHQPILNQLCMSDGATTTMNGRSMRVRECASLSDATLLVTDRELVARFQNGTTFEALTKQVKLVRTWGDCYGYLLVAAGLADIMVDPIMNPWDIMALIPIIRGAGGVITDWHGGKAVNGRSCVATSPQLHPVVMEVLWERSSTMSS